MMFAYPLYATYYHPENGEDGKIFAWLTFFCSLPVITYCLWPILKRFFSSLLAGLIGMEALVVVGVFAAFGLSLNELMHDSHQVYFDSMTVIIALVLLGKIIESKAKFSAKESLLRLTKGLPRRGRKLFSNGTSYYVPIKDISIGDFVVAYAGEKIILDGEVQTGEGTCDESLMTGESLPVAKKPGSKLLGGSILQHGALTYKVLSSMEESAMQRIIHIVEQNVGHKSLYVRAADKIVAWFVPFVFVLAFVTGFSGWILNEEAAMIRAVSVLLIACPCAIGIAAPLAESQILYSLAGLGVIVRNRGCLSIIPDISTYVFDKTGTVTEGNFKVLDGLQNMPNDEKDLLKALSKPSNHLISRAIFNAIDHYNELLVPFEYIQECAGKGMKGLISDKMALLGSAQFFKEQGLYVNEYCGVIENQGTPTSAVYFTPDGLKVYKILLGDSVRHDIPHLVQMLKQMGSKVILLSGDALSSVTTTATFCGMHAYHAGINPLQKRDFIEELRHRGETVCMIGDGINDAPALAVAQIGVSVFSATDISIQVSDIFLTTEQLQVLPQVLNIVKKGQKILKQNLFWAFFYNCIGMGLAFFGMLSPFFAAFAMSASSLIVLFNSRRLYYSQNLKD